MAYWINFYRLTWSSWWETIWPNKKHSQVKLDHVCLRFRRVENLPYEICGKAPSADWSKLFLYAGMLKLKSQSNWESKVSRHWLTFWDETCCFSSHPNWSQNVIRKVRIPASKKLPKRPKHQWSLFKWPFPLEIMDTTIPWNAWKTVLKITRKNIWKEEINYN